MKDILPWGSLAEPLLLFCRWWPRQQRHAPLFVLHGTLLWQQKPPIMATFHPCQVQGGCRQKTCHLPWLILS